MRIACIIMLCSRCSRRRSWRWCEFSALGWPIASPSAASSRHPLSKHHPGGILPAFSKCSARSGSAGGPHGCCGSCRTASCAWWALERRGLWYGEGDHARFLALCFPLCRRRSSACRARGRTIPLSIAIVVRAFCACSLARFSEGA